MSEVRKYQMKASDRPNKHEVRTGQALNAVATAGGLHAAYLTGKEITRAVRNGPEVGRHAKPVKVTRMRRAAGKVPGAGRVLRDPRKAALAGLGAWGVLHTGELVGDAISARALHRQSKIAKEAAVIEQSIVKSYTGAGESGTGRNLELVSKKRPKCPNCELPCDKDGKCPMCGMDCSPRGGVKKADKGDKVRYAAGTAVGAAAGAGAGYGGYRYYQRLQDIVGVPRSTSSGSRRPREGSKEFKRMMRREKMGIRLQTARLKEIGVSGAARDSGRNAASRTKSAIRRMPGGRKAALIGGGLGALYGLAVGDDLTRKGVTKALRRFDSEADRQRRMGLYAGGAAGVAAVAGNETRRMFEPSYHQVEKPVLDSRGRRTGKVTYVNGKFRGPVMRAGVSRKKLAIAAGTTAVSALAGAAAYRRGISRRNQPWA